MKKSILCLLALLSLSYGSAVRASQDAQKLTDLNPSKEFKVRFINVKAGKDSLTNLTTSLGNTISYQDFKGLAAKTIGAPPDQIGELQVIRTQGDRIINENNWPEIRGWLVNNQDLWVVNVIVKPPLAEIKQPNQ